VPRTRPQPTSAEWIVFQPERESKRNLRAPRKLFHSPTGRAGGWRAKPAIRSITWSLAWAHRTTSSDTAKTWGAEWACDVGHTRSTKAHCKNDPCRRRGQPVEPGPCSVSDIWAGNNASPATFPGSKSAAPRPRRNARRRPPTQAAVSGRRTPRPPCTSLPRRPRPKKCRRLARQRLP